MTFGVKPNFDFLQYARYYRLTVSPISQAADSEPVRLFAVLLKDHRLTDLLIRASWPIRIEPPNLFVRFESVVRYGNGKCPFGTPIFTSTRFSISCCAAAAALQQSQLSIEIVLWNTAGDLSCGTPHTPGRRMTGSAVYEDGRCVLSRRPILYQGGV